MKCDKCDRESRATLFFNNDKDDEKIVVQVCSIHFMLRATFMQVHKIWPDLDEEQAQYRANIITAEGFAAASKQCMLEAGIDPEILETAKGWVTDPKDILGSPTNPFTDVDKIVPCKKDKSDIACASCGSGGAIFASCPYDSEINGNDNNVWLCQSCRHERAMDI